MTPGRSIFHNVNGKAIMQTHTRFYTGHQIGPLSWRDVDNVSDAEMSIFVITSEPADGRFVFVVADEADDCKSRCRRRCSGVKSFVAIAPAANDIQRRRPRRAREGDGNHDPPRLRLGPSHALMRRDRPRDGLQMPGRERRKSAVLFCCHHPMAILTC